MILSERALIVTQWVLALVSVSVLAFFIETKHLMAHIFLLCAVCVIATLVKKKTDEMFKAPEVPGKTIWLLNWGEFTRFQEVKRSWAQHNPEWSVVVVDAHNVSEYLSSGPKGPKGPVEWHDRDGVRTALIAQHGGVVADNNVACLAPLDDWVYELLDPAGFWAYTKPNQDGYVANFVVGVQGSSYSPEIPRLDADEHINLLIQGREQEGDPLSAAAPFVVILPESSKSAFTLERRLKGFTLPNVKSRVSFSKTVCVSPVCGNAATMRTFSDICKSHDIQFLAYDKCNFCKNAPVGVHARPRRNLGREMETYLWFVITHYYNLPEHLVFCPANEKHDRVARFKTLARNVSLPPCPPLDTFAERFYLDAYEGVPLVPASVRPLKAWVEKYIGPWDTMKNKSSMCWNGVMRTTRAQLLQRPLSFYKALHEQTVISNNTEVGHYLERTMGIVFG